MEHSRTHSRRNSNTGHSEAKPRRSPPLPYSTARRHCLPGRRFAPASLTVANQRTGTATPHPTPQRHGGTLLRSAPARRLFTARRNGIASLHLAPCSKRMAIPSDASHKHSRPAHDMATARRYHTGPHSAKARQDDTQRSTPRHRHCLTGLNFAQQRHGQPALPDATARPATADPGAAKA